MVNAINLATGDKQDEILSNFPIASGIKSVQRGILAGQTIENETISIPISQVNASKSFINLPLHALYQWEIGSFQKNLYGHLDSNGTVLKLTNDSSSAWNSSIGSISWEVIEFY